LTLDGSGHRGRGRNGVRKRQVEAAERNGNGGEGREWNVGRNGNGGEGREWNVGRKNWKETEGRLEGWKILDGTETVMERETVDGMETERKRLWKEKPWTERKTGKETAAEREAVERKGKMETAVEGEAVERNGTE
jgi:hypothetical protein